MKLSIKITPLLWWIFPHIETVREWTPDGEDSGYKKTQVNVYFLCFDIIWERS